MRKLTFARHSDHDPQILVPSPIRIFWLNPKILYRIRCSPQDAGPSKIIDSLNDHEKIHQGTTIIQYQFN